MFSSSTVLHFKWNDTDGLNLKNGPALIALLLPLKFLAYWSIPVRIMEYAFDGIGRIGMVTTPSAAEFAATGDQNRLRELGIYANRYCFALFAPYAVSLWVYGPQAFALWIRKPGA